MGKRSFDLDFRQGVLDALFGHPFALAIGTCCFTIASLACWTYTDDVGFLYFAIGNFTLGSSRVWLVKTYLDVRDAAKAEKGGMTAAQLNWWRAMCISAGSVAALMVGSMGAYAVAVGHDPYAILVSITVALASSAGAVARSFGSPRYVLLQTMGLGIPPSVALAIFGNTHERILALLYCFFVLSISPLAGGLRKTLHSAIRSERDVKVLADELGEAVETMPNGLLMFDESNNLSVLNSRAAHILGLPYPLREEQFHAGEILNRIVAAFELNAASIARMKRAFLRTRRMTRSETSTLQKPNGQIFEFRTQTGADGNLVVRIDNVTEAHQNHQRVITMARTDALTGLPNRSYFFAQANEMRETLEEGEQIHLAVIDISDFRHLNDIYGNAAGDEALKTIARRLKAMARSGELCARLGDDEFAFLSKGGADGLYVQEELRERLVEAGTAIMTLGADRVPMLTSIGLAQSGAGALEAGIPELLSRADHARSHIRGASSTIVQVFEPSMQEALDERRHLREELKIAVRDEAFHCHFQPIVDARHCQVVGVEALCRWTHPALGVISPGKFIPLAEEMGLISAITRQQLREACRVATLMPETVGMSVNLSAHDLASDDVIEAIADALLVSGLDAPRLTVEVTETSLLSLDDDILARVKRIKALGVKLALDDFGTGYSSLSYLHALPFDRLKIDRAFTVAMEKEMEGLDEGAMATARTTHVLSAIVTLATDLGMETVVEGVETVQQLDRITACVSAQLFQGYLFSRPREEASAVEFARTFDQQEWIQQRAVAG